MKIAFDLKEACFGFEKLRIGIIHKKVGHSNWGMQIAECGVGSKLKVPAYADLLRQGYGGQEAPEGRQSLKKTITPD